MATRRARLCWRWMYWCIQSEGLGLSWAKIKCAKIFPVNLFIYKVKPLFLENQSWREYTCCLAPPPNSFWFFFTYVFLRQKANQEARFLRAFYKTENAAALECCKKKNINPWDGCISLERKTWDGGGRMYCFQDVLLYTAEWSSGWLVGFCLFGGVFLLLLFSWVLLICPFFCLSLHLLRFPYLPWLRSRKQDLALFPDIQRNIKVQRNSVFCFPSWLGFTDLHKKGTCSQRGQESPSRTTK